MSHIWGTGVMHPHYGVGSAVASNIHAVRGKLSHCALHQGGIDVSDVPLGDPGFLAPALFGIAKSARPTNRLGVVPHYVERANRHFRRLVAEPGVSDLNVHADPEQFLRAMADCEAVISSSLHGLIFAEALGIPNLWVTASNEIAGGPFKFDDWFSTTATPQMSGHPLASTDTVDSLIDRTILHNSTIDVEALHAAFPHNLLNKICEEQDRRIIPTNVCRARPLPTFLISFNRGPLLEKAIAAIKQLDDPTDIVVHDNGSTDAATLAILDKLESSGTHIARREALNSPDDLDNVNDTVRDFFSDWAEPSRYIVSDCDVDMTITAPEALTVYDELLNSFRQVESVGPMLRIRDIPTSYPLFNHVMNRHIEQFWHRQPEWTPISFGRVAYIEAMIDTTLALHRAGERFRRLKRSLRVYEPYEAQHLDWYISDVVDDVYGKTSNPTISHWNNAIERDLHITAQLEYDHYYAVRKNEFGDLEVYEEHIPAQSANAKRCELSGAILPFVEADESQRKDRISRTEILRHERRTDTERWRSVASHYESWRQRSKLLASYVRPGERVFEFGAGNSVLAGALPAGCGYVGSDVAPLARNIVIFDLNAPTLPQLRGHDVAVFSGVLEYVHDVLRLSAFLSQNFASVICSYAACVSSSVEEIERRRYSGWFNDFSEVEFLEIFRGAGFSLSKAGKWEKQMLFRWDRP
ncbi:polysaccharide pyruvyl transferase family protein [Methylocapsa polymorpha]|uniref:Polysaccharide pyruvyl transferase family protein n=1 Tax=Methylocapsa polymorpha TaxID=3080828 RepID=A0ABZ0HRT4_9HYPH|nr:polysaccharide pyruvyl transferase family protein [Methylocapsa sp. RX1]